MLLCPNCLLISLNPHSIASFSSDLDAHLKKNDFLVNTLALKCLLRILHMESHLLTTVSFLFSFFPAALVGCLWDGVAAFGTSGIDVNLFHLYPFLSLK